MVFYWFDLARGWFPSLSFLPIMYATITEDTSALDYYDEPRLHMERLLRAPLIEFDISLRILLPLEAVGVRRLKDLIKYSHKRLLKVNRLGVHAVAELEALLASLDLSLAK